jgi:hypothetical protein
VPGPPGGRFGVNGVALAVPATPLPIGTGDLMDRHAVSGQEAGQPGTERRCPLDSSDDFGTEGVCPRQQAPVAVRVGGDLKGSQSSADAVQGHGDVAVLVDVHTYTMRPLDPAAGALMPFLRFLVGWEVGAGQRCDETESGRYWVTAASSALPRGRQIAMKTQGPVTLRVRPPGIAVSQSLAVTLSEFLPESSKRRCHATRPAR